MRNYTGIDQLILRLDRSLRTLLPNNLTANRPYPGEHCEEPALTTEEKRRVAGFMRVNHAGEICAQALYDGHAFAAHDQATKATMQQAALEENDHLAWCQQRLTELDSHTSYLNPLWYFGAYAIGYTASLFGDKWGLGFVMETEHQVVKHLENHLCQLPKQDEKSRRVLTQMRDDELHHATSAEHHGAAELPKPIKIAMRWSSKVMTQTAYWI